MSNYYTVISDRAFATKAKNTRNLLVRHQPGNDRLFASAPYLVPVLIIVTVLATDLFLLALLPAATSRTRSDATSAAWKHAPAFLPCACAWLLWGRHAP